MSRRLTFTTSNDNIDPAILLVAEVPVSPKAIRVMTCGSGGRLRGDEEQEYVDDPSPAAPAALPTIRVRGNLTHSLGPTTSGGGSLVNHLLRVPESLFARKPPALSRPSVSDAEADVKRLTEEVRALQWLARRKEQEWDQVVRLLKRKEEKLMVADRKKVVAAAAENEIPVIMKNVLPPRSAASATPSIGNAVNGSGVAAVNLPTGAATAGTIIIKKPTGAVLAGAAGIGPGRRILKPVGQITQAQLQAMKSSGKINANQLQSLTQGKTVLATAAATLAPSDQRRTVVSGPTSSKYTKIAPKPAGFGASGPKIVTVQGSSTAAVVGANHVLVSANGGSVSAKPAPIRHTQTSEMRSEEQREQGKITMSSSSIPPCSFCRAKKSKFVCSYCKEKWYCSRKCQLDDWDAHEDECADCEDERC